MKKKSDLRMLLGITQLEMAMLLGINRVQVALYETGKRQLPTAAYGKLATLLAQIEEQQTSKPVVQHPNSEKLKKQIEQLLHENIFQLMTCERRIAAVQKKQEAAEKVQQLSDGLNAQSAKGHSEKAAYILMNSKASRFKTDLLSADLLKLQIRQEVLKFKKELLEKKLKG